MRSSLCWLDMRPLSGVPPPSERILACDFIREKEAGVIETENQRRWWFATHPEYSWSRRGTRTRKDGEEDENERNLSPEEVDAYVDHALKHVDGTVADLLRAVKCHFGTEGEKQEQQEALNSGAGTAAGPKAKPRDEPLTYQQGRKDGMKWALGPNSGSEPPFVPNPDYMEGFYDGVREAKEEYLKGWEAGYWGTHGGKVPPPPHPEDQSAYAQGVRNGVATALDEQALWRQKWVENFPFGIGAHHSRTLGRNLEKQGELRPSGDHDAHHIVAWNHWRAERARQILEQWGIDIDAAVNGVWLPRAYHRTLNNSAAYYDAVHRMLEKATSKKDVLETLQTIKQLLSTGEFPL